MATLALPTMDLRVQAPPGHLFAQDALDGMVGRVMHLRFDLTARAISIRPEDRRVQISAVTVDDDGTGATITIEEAPHG